MINNERINIFTGHFGSGKTEVAINFAIFLKKHYNKVAIIDLDIVNSYFRTQDAKQLLESQGIKVIAPLFANTNVDLPTLPPDIFALLQNKEYKIVFDVGGDDIGAVALGGFYKYFTMEQYHMYFVINSKRPMTDSVHKIIEVLREIEQSSRLKVTSLINNTNLSYSSNIEDLIEGQKNIKEVSRQIMVPISHITAKVDILEQLPESLKQKAFPIQLYLKLPWER